MSPMRERRHDEDRFSRRALTKLLFAPWQPDFWLGRPLPLLHLLERLRGWSGQLARLRRT